MKALTLPATVNERGKWIEEAALQAGRSHPYLDGALRAVRLTLNFSRRSSITELVGFYLASMLAGFTLILTASFFVSPERESQLALGLGWASTLPLPALLVRRLLDQGRSGKLALLMGPPAVFQAASDLASLLGGTEGRIAFDRFSYFAYWPVLACALVVLILFFLPGTSGPNRFGPDPRPVPTPAPD